MKKLIFPIAIDDYSLKKEGAVEYSETIIHESEVHFLSRDFSCKPNDPLYGIAKMSEKEEHKAYGRTGKEKPKEGSKAEEYLKQAKEAWKQLKKNEEEKEF